MPETSGPDVPVSGNRSAAASRGLVWTLVRTDFKARYHGTLGGFVWALLKPLTMFLVLMAVFSFVFAADPDYQLNLIVGLFLWDFFAEGTKAGLTSLHARVTCSRKARFPSWILVVTSISNAVHHADGVHAWSSSSFLAGVRARAVAGAVALFALYLVL